jgi:hypothetical protein
MLTVEMDQPETFNREDRPDGDSSNAANVTDISRASTA